MLSPERWIGENSLVICLRESTGHREVETGGKPGPSGSMSRMFKASLNPRQTVNILTNSTYSMALQPLKSFGRPLMRVPLSDSVLVTFMFY